MEVKVKVNSITIIEDVLDAAIERGMNRCDKYSQYLLTDLQRQTLKHEIESSFWIALEDVGGEIV